MRSQRIPALLSWLAVVAVGVATYYQMRHQPLFHDAAGYVEAARGISDQGLLGQWPLQDRRTYGYPLVIRGVLAPAAQLDVGTITALFVVQWSLFVGSAWLASRVLFTSRRTRLMAFVAVAANPVLVVYTAQALSESLTIACTLFTVAAIGHAARTGAGWQSALWLASGAAVSTFSMEVRPANLLVPACYGLAAVAVLWQTRRRRSWPVQAWTFVVVALALVAPLIPQVLINDKQFDRASPLPVTPLNELQATYGVQLVRYATNVDECGQNNSLLFVNPFDHPVQEVVTTGAMVRYYALDWPSGPQTAFLHVFSALDPRPFLTYQHDYGAGYERALQVLVLALVLLACLGLAWAVPRVRQRDGTWRIEALYLGAVGVCALGVLATSATEHRFGVVPLTIISLLAAAGVARLPSLKPVGRWALGAGFAAGSLAWITLSDLVLNTSVLWQACS